jgi:hypothetical protein
METLNEGSMKFVLNGRTFDTATSTVAAVSRGVIDGAESKRYENVLYRTKLGNFFVHHHETVKFKYGKPVVDDSAAALTPELAVSWIQSTSAMVLDPTGLPLPDEA